MDAVHREQHAARSNTHKLRCFLCVLCPKNSWVLTVDTLTRSAIFMFSGWDVSPMSDCGKRLWLWLATLWLIPYLLCSGTLVACQATTCHLPLRFRNAPVFRK